MSVYPAKISERLFATKNGGKLKDANAVGTSASFVCGAALRFTLRIDCATKEILAAQFQTNGCGFLTAAADISIEKITGRFLTELHGADKHFLHGEIENVAGKFPAARKHCLELATQTLQNALANFRASQIEEFSGEKALICNCFGVSEETIESAIKEKSLATVEQVIDACNAGGGCGSCQPLIQELIDIYYLEN